MNDKNSLFNDIIAELDLQISSLEREEKFFAYLTAEEQMLYSEILKKPFLYKAFPVFLVQYFSQPQEAYERAMKFALKSKLPDPRTGNLVAQYRKGFMPEDKDPTAPGFRWEWLFALKASETVQARKFMAAHPHYHFAITVLQDALIDYLNVVREKFHKYSKDKKFELRKKDFPENFLFNDYWHTTKDGHLSAAFLEFIKAGSSFSFVHDLSPIMAHSFQRYGEITKQGLRDSLVSLFQKQAFRSDRRGGTRCPFSSHFAAIMSIGLRRQGDGTLQSFKGEFGDLLLFLMEEVKQAVPESDIGKLEEALRFDDAPL
ncbi:MAG: hypothetical protein LRZ85_01740 [Alphaproteobacteria bacterium]|nr:hypothetical protein [Alphaproteobacteria bacterium]MCD8526508.1 hypothetical protein [Alphaproteobacteria bacterium]MCD8570352.1 hypothetical protein [Alphaproteobacteria bacterium]